MPKCGFCKIHLKASKFFPHLKSGSCPKWMDKNRWEKVFELRKKGKDASADRVVRDILGIKGPEMSEETKEKLRAYNEDHKEEIAERAKLKRLQVRILKQRLSKKQTKFVDRGKL